MKKNKDQLVQEFIESEKNFSENDDAVTRCQHKAIRKVTEDFYRLSFNTAISAMMEYVNELYKLKIDGFSDQIWREALQTLTQLIAPFAPHISDELWQQLGGHDLVQQNPWPIWDDKLITSKTMTIVVQVNGKLRAKFDVSTDANEAEIKKTALKNDNVKAYIGDKKPTKTIYIPGRLINIVVAT